ncbi:hypothetical protein CDO52_16465 [Nocardiopsis gilva YIM 90087]|uniref:Secreted protein n=1 Tax=Nocardiopsis gilva YIM 90087 TaxID=1235441 RepID=A0A223S7R5_9ACTN|nr:hypothetical protein [Nocardiopsis gilva]ASU84171.1 hypothetical protein CDO52_16465 [Nocardiopsis gilva YIM 90087]
MLGRFALATATAAMAAAVALPMPAYAAEGRLVWVTNTGQTKSISNPPDGRCIQVGEPAFPVFPARVVHNRTDTAAVAYSDLSCQRDVQSLPPGSSSRENIVASVKFGPVP